MTISSQTPRTGPTNGTGSATTFSYTFQIEDEDELVVNLITLATGAEVTQTISTEYTVTGVGSASGGTVEMVTPPTTGQALVITRSVTSDQQVDLQNRASVIPQTLESAYDKLTRIVQDSKEVASRSLVFSAGSDKTDIEIIIPSGGVTADKTLVFNSAGTSLVTGPDVSDLAAATAAQLAAEAAQVAAETAQTNAETAETNAETAETNAETAETNASGSAASAAASALAASNDAAATAADLVQTNLDQIATSADAAATAADAAATAADAASTAADVLLTNADVVSTNADAAATAADLVQTNLDQIATTADAASTAADVLLTAADVVSTNADAAATAADLVQTNLDQIATAADAVSTAQDAVDTAADAAATAADAIATAADAAAAAASYDDFDDRYLGAKASDPALDNDGDPLATGALYFDTTLDVMKVYDGATWVAAYASLSGALTTDNNLSDLDNASTARTNLGVAIGSDVQAYDATIVVDADIGSTVQGVLSEGAFVDGDKTQLDSTVSLDTKGGDLASATTLPVTSAADSFDVTGTTTITSLAAVGVGKQVTLHFDGILTLTHHATDLVLPSGANITTAAGDIGVFYEYASGDWRCISYTLASGESLVGGSDGTITDTQTFTASGTWTKPSEGTIARVTCWGGGGSGGYIDGLNNYSTGGGGGGGCTIIEIPLTLLDATEAVVVGAGAAAPTSGTVNGNDGGKSSFASLVEAYGGGGGGASPSGGGGGGSGGTGERNVSGGGDAVSGGYAGGNPGTGSNGAEADAEDGPGTINMHMSGSGGGGGGGCGANTDESGTSINGGDAEWGGGGGGGGNLTNPSPNGVGGTSTNGGNGGNGGYDAVAGTDGTAPGGGGGGHEGKTSGPAAAGSGARGEVKVEVY